MVTPYAASHQVDFENGYGASICIGMYAHGEFNVAVVDLSTGDLCYDTTVTSDTVRCIDFADMVATVEMIKALPTRDTNESRLRSERGLCTSIAETNRSNAERIKCIIAAYLDGDRILQRSHRAADDWSDCCDMPSDFSEYRYRTVS